MANLRKEFSKIYDKWINKIYRFIFLKVNSQEIAQDLCSETFLKGWQAYQKIQKIENPSAFLYQIARNLVIDFYRKKGRTEIVSTDVLPMVDPRPDIEEKIALDSDLEQIKIVLANLKEDYQNIVIWHYIDDIPIPEIAKILDKTEETTRVTLHRALKALKEQCNKKLFISS